MEKHGKTLKNMENHGKTLKNMEKHGQTWKNIEKHGKTLKNMEKHGKTWKNMEKHGETWRNKYLGDPWEHSVYFRRRTARLSSLQRFRSQRLSRGGWLCHFTVTRQSDGPSQVQSWQKLGRVLLWIADLRCST